MNPEIVNLELTNACNLGCSFCDHPVLSKKIKIEDMPIQMLEKILKDIAEDDVFELGLVGLGEPLLCHNLAQALALIDSYRHYFKRISLNSNAVALNQEKAELLLNSSINFITFSLNAATQKSYIKLMRRDYFSKVVENLEFFLKLRQDKKTAKMEIRIQIMSICEAEIEKVKTLFSDYLDEHTKIFARSMYAKPNVECQKGIEFPDAKIKRWPCWSIYSRIYIDVAGNIYPCTIGNDCYRETASLCIGNVREGKIRNIFNNASIQSAREAAENGNLPFRECEPCNIWSLLPNNFALKDKVWQNCNNSVRIEKMKD